VDSNRSRDLEDLSLMAQVSGGDIEALGSLFERYSRVVLRFATRIVGDPVHAQDLLQDVFIYIMQRNCMFDPRRGTVIAWILQVTYSKATNRQRHQARNPTLRTISIDRARDVADPRRSEDRLIGALDARRLLGRTLLELTSAQSETLWLHFSGGYSLREVSRMRRESPGNTRHHYYRGLASLRNALAGTSPPSPRRNGAAENPAMVVPLTAGEILPLADPFDGIAPSQEH
jgi:RNA polymerase sigma-70 factor, ECF subfamily